MGLSNLSQALQYLNFILFEILAYAFLSEFVKILLHAYSRHDQRYSLRELFICKMGNPKFCWGILSCETLKHLIGIFLRNRLRMQFSCCDRFNKQSWIICKIAAFRKLDKFSFPLSIEIGRQAYHST